MASNRFQIRNRLLDIVGEYTTKELLARIAAGRFTGDEEVAGGPPFEKWQKLASHPVFYDAFLKRLYSTQYQSPPGVEPSVSAKEEERQGKTRRESTQDREEKEEEQGKTHQLAQNPEAGHTIHQEDIDALFSQASAKNLGREKTSAGKTDLIVAESSSALDAPLPPLEVSMAAEAAEPASLAAAASVAKNKNRRLRLVLAVLVPVSLYWMWGDKNPSLITDKMPTPVVGLGSSATPQERAITLEEEAAALAIQDSLLFYQGAYDVLREGLELDSGNGTLLRRLAMASVRLATDSESAEKRRPEIEQLIQRARSSDPQSSELFRVEAILAHTEGKLEEAKNFALKAAEADPVASENLLLIGELHYGAGNYSEARNVFAEAVKADGERVRALYYLARVEWELGAIDASQRNALEALKRNPLHPHTYLLLAEIAAHRNQFKEARGLFETCGRLARFTTPDVSGRAYERLGEMHELAGNKAEAQNSYLLAYYYLKSGSAELKARVSGQDLSEKNLKNLAVQAEYQAPYFQEQGMGLLSQGKTEEALRFFQAAHLLAPRDGLALIQLGEVMEKTASSYEDFRRVMSYYQRAIDRDPTEAMGYIKLGLLETEQYNFERGFKLLMQALALAPESEKPYVALGKHYYKREDFNEALNHFLRAAKINPSDSEILYYAGKLRLVYKKEGAKDAQRFFSQAYTLDPRNYDALSEWLKLKVVNYDKNFAIKFMNNLIASEPKNPMLYWVLGEVYAENKEFRRAVTYYHKSLDFDNRQSKVRMSLAKALEAVGELDKAVAEYRLSSLLDRRNSDGFYHAADLLFQMKAYTQSEEVLRFLLSVTPNYPGVHRYLSKIHQLREQKDAAIEAMKQEVAANPQNYKYVLELAELNLEYEKWEDAISELKKVTALPASAQAPEFKTEKIRAYLLLSRAYRAQSQPENAEGAVRLALSMDPNDPELHRELGYVYYSQQRDKEGVREFEFYLQRSPAARDATAIRGLIKRMEIEE